MHALEMEVLREFTLLIPFIEQKNTITHHGDTFTMRIKRRNQINYFDIHCQGYFECHPHYFCVNGYVITCANTVIVDYRLDIDNYYF
jgi:hypothetical protein